MSNLPDCTGCTDPDPFDRNSDGVTHQIGTKQHPMTTPERQVATDAEMRDVLSDLNDYGIVAPRNFWIVKRILNRLSAAEARNAELDEAVELLKRMTLWHEVAGEMIGDSVGGWEDGQAVKWQNDYEAARAFLTRHQRDNAQGVG